MTGSSPFSAAAARKPDEKMDAGIGVSLSDERQNDLRQHSAAADLEGDGISGCEGRQRKTAGDGEIPWRMLGIFGEQAAGITQAVYFSV